MRELIRTFWTAAFAALLALGPSACGDDDVAVVPDASPADASAPLDAPREPVGVPCDTDAECDDSVFCTRDICDPTTGRCRNPVDPAVCDDGIFCNGFEQCDVPLGCVPGPPESCNDNDVCTLDRCDEEAKTCRQRPRDFDEDGEADWHCEGGTDCDDRDPLRGATTAEVCSDGVDNDCDEQIDEASCGRPAHDDCADPLDVTGGGQFTVNTSGAVPDYETTCGGALRDVVLEFVLDEPQSVRIAAEGSGFTTVAVRDASSFADDPEDACRLREQEVDCANGIPAVARIRELPPGRHYAIVSAATPGEISVDVSLAAPIPEPPNETCASPAPVSPSAPVAGTFVDANDDLMLRCGGADAPDLVYSFTLVERANARVSLLSATGETVNFAVRTSCADDATELRCVRGAPVSTTMHDLAPGTYAIIAESPPGNEIDFVLDVALSPPTAPAPGDQCAEPLTLEAGISTVGTLSDKEDDIETSCGFFYRDAVYAFTLTERSDVALQVEGAGTFMNLSVRTDCDDPATELRCAAGSPARADLRDLGPGTYFAVVESFAGSGFAIELSVTPPRPVVEVTGNDRCEDAAVVPAGGGLFSGDTLTLSNDYETQTCGSMARSNDAAFRLDLTNPQRVVASTEGSSFDTALHLHRGSCMSRAEIACDDDGGSGSSSTLDQVLEPGTFFLVVDGFGTSSAGMYFLDVTVSNP